MGGWGCCWQGSIVMVGPLLSGPRPDPKSAAPCNLPLPQPCPLALRLEQAAVLAPPPLPVQASRAHNRPGSSSRRSASSESYGAWPAAHPSRRSAASACSAQSRTPAAAARPSHQAAFSGAGEPPGSWPASPASRPTAAVSRHHRPAHAAAAALYSPTISATQGGTHALQPTAHTPQPRL
jgi:hypothetical protein